MRCVGSHQVTHRQQRPPGPSQEPAPRIETPFGGSCSRQLSRGGVHYFGAEDPQRRFAPHAHPAVLNLRAEAWGGREGNVACGRQDPDHGARPKSLRLRRTLLHLAAVGNPPRRPRSILGDHRDARSLAPLDCWCSRRSWRGSDPAAPGHRLCPRAWVRGVRTPAADFVFRPDTLVRRDVRVRLAIGPRWFRVRDLISRRLSAVRRARFRSRSLCFYLLLAEDDRDPVQVEIFTRPTGALFEGLSNSKPLVGRAGELEVRLELADYPVASALRRAFGYHRPIVVTNPQRDHPLEAGAVASDVGRVPHNVARCGAVELDERSP